MNIAGVIEDGKWVGKALPPDVRLVLEEHHLRLSSDTMWVKLYPEWIVMQEGISPSDALRYAALLRLAHEIWEQAYGDWQEVTP